MKLVWVAGGAVLLFFIFFLPSAGAVPAVPVTLVAEVTYSVSEQSGGITYDADVNLTWRLSSNDPDQTAGSFTYNLLVGAGGTDPSLWLSTTPVAVTSPARAGWVSYVQQVAVGAGTSPVYSFAIVANDTVPSSSGLSCIVTLNLSAVGNQAQCGSTFAAPAGVSVIVVNECCGLDDGYGANATLRWRVSANDSDQVNGSGLHYWPYIGPAPESMFNYTGAAQSVDASGVLKVTVEQFTAPGGTVPLYAKVKARDPGTRERSDFSCVVFVTNGQLYERAYCGTLGSPSGGFDTDGPTYPMLNVTQTAGWLGVEESVVGAFLGSATVMGFALIGFALGGPVAGIAAGIGSLAWVAVLGIMPFWALVLIFLAAAAVIVFKFKGGGE